VRTKAVLFWSSGKDSALALHRVRAQGKITVVGALTTIASNRVAMHGVPEALLDCQARAMGLPLTKILIPFPCPNVVYESKTLAALEQWKKKGVNQVIFGDLYLEDIRAYREKTLHPTGLTPVFPVWGKDTAATAREIIQVGIGATLTSVDPRRLPPDFVGREFDRRLLEDLPPEVDPCGENGEFHTFVHKAPFFAQSIPIRLGKHFSQDGFEYVDLELGKANVE
jgi:uncharacterized protein (TIGR00290 family)